MNYSLHNTIVKSIVKHSFTLFDVIAKILSLIAMLLPCYCHWVDCCNATMQAGFKGLLVILSFILPYEYKSIYIRCVKTSGANASD